MSGLADMANLKPGEHVAIDGIEYEVKPYANAMIAPPKGFGLYYLMEVEAWQPEPGVYRQRMNDSLLLVRKGDDGRAWWVDVNTLRRPYEAGPSVTADKARFEERFTKLVPADSLEPKVLM